MCRFTILVRLIQWLSNFRGPNRQTSLDFLPFWYDQLQQFSSNGRLSASAEESLLLKREPQALRDLLSQFSARGFHDVPEIVLLSNADFNGAIGAFAVSPRCDCFNSEFFATAMQDSIMAVLAEELGHRLDAKLNLMDAQLMK